MADAQHQLVSPIMGTVFHIKVSVGDVVRQNTEVVIVESMKMEHPVEAGYDGTVTSIAVKEGDTVSAGQLLLVLTPGPTTVETTAADTQPQSVSAREDFIRYEERRFLTTDAARPDAVARRHNKGQ